jgi:NitT/TauT family transport system substrate-binding protein
LKWDRWLPATEEEDLIMSGSIARRGFARLLALLGAAVISFAAHGQSPAPRQDVTLRLDWIPTWYHSVFYLALNRGYYSDAGLNVTIGQGKGSAATAQVVGAGSETFGLMDMSTMMLAISNGAPLVAVGGLIQRSPEAIISLSTANIRAPKDLEGKRWGFTAGSSGETIFKLFAAKTGVDESKLSKVTVDAAAKLTFLLAEKIDFITDWAVSVNPLIKAQGKTPANLIYADYGVHFNASTLATTRSMLASKPEVVRGFLAATVKGIEEALKDPPSAVDALVGNQPSVAGNRELMIGQMKELTSFLHSDQTHGKPTLWLAPEDVASTLEIAKRLRPTAESLKVSDLFTDEFLPKR